MKENNVTNYNQQKKEVPHFQKSTEHLHLKIMKWNLLLKTLLNTASHS